MHVLVADNDPEFLELLASTLEQLGADVVCARSGGELQTVIAASAPFDVVVTDVSMPQMTGLEVMASARTAGLPCPIVIMTAAHDRTTIAQVAALGEHVTLLRKPFSFAALRRAMRACAADPAPVPETAPGARAAGTRRAG